MVRRKQAARREMTDTGPLCHVCKNEKHKYKCPKCLLKYCSVSCFKEHKEEPRCRSPKLKVNKVKQWRSKKMIPPAVREDGELSQSDEEETEDKVSKDRLDRLGQCDELKSLLENPHLQNMLQHMDSSMSPAKDIHRSMMEPIFTEFADCCLRVVNPERYTQES